MKPLDVLLILVSLLFATGLVVDQRWGPERKRHEESLKFQREHLEKVTDLLRDQQKKSGRYPTMEEGLESVPGLREATFSGEFKNLAPQLKDLPYVRTPQCVPYLYENRRGADAASRAAFKNSPSKGDRKAERYSERLDDGVVVISLGLMHDRERFFGQAWLDALIWFGGGLVITLSIAYIFARNRNKSAERYRGINATIIVGIAIVLSLVFVVTGGRNRLGASHHPKFEAMGTRADLATEYLDLLCEWCDGGVYARSAYDKVARQLATEFGIKAPEPSSSKNN
jgi:hypothetical protein